MDDYIGIDDLSRYLKVTGCHNIGWHDKKVIRTWCVCKEDNCNGKSIEDLDKLYPNPVVKDPHSKLYDYADDNYENGANYETQNDRNILPNEQTQNIYAGAGGYAKEADLSNSHTSGQTTNAKAGQEGANADRPFYDKQKIYTDVVEQVHYGKSNDIFVNQPDHKDTYNNYYDNYGQYEDPRYENVDSLVQQPYYPYKEGEVSAFNDDSQSLQYQDDISNEGPNTDDTANYYDPPDAKQSDLQIIEEEEEKVAPEKGIFINILTNDLR